MPKHPNEETDPTVMMYNALQVILKDRKISAWLSANDPNAYRQAVSAARAYMGSAEVESTIHCSCDCPMWDKERAIGTVVVVACACGRREHACVECLNAGRITSCMACTQDRSLPDII